MLDYQFPEKVRFYQSNIIESYKDYKFQILDVECILTSVKDEFKFILSYDKSYYEYIACSYTTLNGRRYENILFMNIYGEINMPNVSTNTFDHFLGHLIVKKSLYLNRIGCFYRDDKEFAKFKLLA